MAKLRKLWRRDDGMTTAEYAVGLIAAVAFAGILYKVVTSGTVTTALTAIVKRALSQ
jgi:Flp pilus assembly pilin Flp